MSVPLGSLIQREVKSLKPVVGYFLEKKKLKVESYGHLVTTVTFLSRRNAHTFSYKKTPRATQ